MMILCFAGWSLVPHTSWASERQRNQKKRRTTGSVAVETFSTQADGVSQNAAPSKGSQACRAPNAECLQPQQSPGSSVPSATLGHPPGARQSSLETVASFLIQAWKNGVGPCSASPPQHHTTPRASAAVPGVAFPQKSPQKSSSPLPGLRDKAQVAHSPPTPPARQIPRRPKKSLRPPPSPSWSPLFFFFFPR